jgi:protein-S-isoprenylcysteine O-methyltransferase Ste14
MNGLKHIAAVLMLPGMVVGLVPAFIIYGGGNVHLGWGLDPVLNGLTIGAGIILIGLGLFLMIQTISLFVMVGKGTLAPWMPTEKLVVRGIYRNVRNPMITGVFCILVGEAVLFGSLGVLYWFIGVAVLNAIYIPLAEEPGLEERFGEDYRRYKQNVPRWIPRLSAWDDGGGKG